MLTLLRQARGRLIEQAYVYCLWEGETLVSWVLVYNMCFTNFVHAYTRASHRRQGLGARILAAAHADYPKLVCEAHDKRSAAFYVKTEVSDGLR
jgi:GNAT superfamily N-acetyltransferase